MPAAAPSSYSMRTVATSDNGPRHTTAAVATGNVGAKVELTLLLHMKLLAISAVIIAMAYHGAVWHVKKSLADEESGSTNGTDNIQILTASGKARMGWRIPSVFVCKHYDSCDQLVTNGSFVTKDTWQPRGCLMHNYTTEETKQCLRAAAATTNDTTRIVLIGDSRLRYLTTRILLQLGASVVVRYNVTMLKKNPFSFNMKELHFQLDYYKENRPDKERVKEVVNAIKMRPLTLLVTGDCLHYIVDYGARSRKEGIPAYKKTITSFAKEFESLPPSTTILYRLTEKFNTKKLRKQQIFYKRNDDIDLYNGVALKVFNNSRVKLWHSSHRIALHRQWDYDDGIHANNSTMFYDMQMMLNLVCNRHMPSLPTNSCCTMSSGRIYKAPTSNSGNGFVKFKSSSTTSFRSQQIILATVLATVFMCGVVVSVWPTLQLLKWTPNNWMKGASSEDLEDQLHLVTTKPEDLPDHQPVGSTATKTPNTKKLIEKQKKSLQKIVWSLVKLPFILGYFILCDRFDFFAKASKEFSVTHFGAPLLVVTCAAAFSITTKRTGVEQILSRDVTDEWKGWMQFVLLVYHASGASKNLPIYMHVRVIVSSYLFLTGYGHFSRYWKTGNAGGFTRYCQVMYRLNFLTALLCLVMEQPYMNYYFVVLVSFWYTVLHVVLALPPHLTESGLERTLADFVRAGFKIAMVALAIAALSSIEIFQVVFGWRNLNGLFELQGYPGVQEWRFRWTLDRFSVLYGMIFALMCQAWTRFWPNNSIGSRWPSTKWGSALLAALSLSSFVCYPLLLQTCNTKRACNDLHPYFTWIPTLGYIFFRHHCSFFRSHFSPLFAFLGQISLELFVSQYHILLASNTHSLLVLVPGQPIINTVVTGLVFLCSAHEINNITCDLQPILAPSDVKKMIRNIVLGGFFILSFVYWDSML